MNIVRPEVAIEADVNPYVAEDIMPIDDDYSSSRPGSSIHFSLHQRESHYIDNDDGI